MLVKAYGLTEAGDAACLLPPGEAEQQDPLPRTSLDQVDKLALRAELELDPPDAKRTGSQGPS